MESLVEDALVDDLRVGDLLVKRVEEVDQDIVYDVKYFVVIKTKDHGDIGIFEVVLAAARPLGDVETGERLDGYSGDRISDMGYLRVIGS